MRKIVLFGAAFLLSMCGLTLGAIVYSGSQNVVLRLTPMSPMDSRTIDVASQKGDWDDFRVDLWLETGMGMGMGMGMDMNMGTRLEIYALGSGRMVPGAMVMGMSGIVGLGDLATNLALGEMIGPRSSQTKQGWGLLTGSGNFHEDGGYIGLALGNPFGGTQYGWLHMAGQSSIGTDTHSVVLDGWAYDTQPGEAIAAGDTGVVPVPYNHLAWEQPPIEWDVLSKTPVLCGWGEPSYSEEIPNATEGSASCPADDFRCLGPMPITSVHWWGSYENWQSTSLPSVGPDAWRITFSANVPADSNNTFSRPGAQFLQFEVSPDRVGVEWVGSDRFPGDQPSDGCFRYSLTLNPTEYFWQSLYEGDIFWISITAVYKTHKADPIWGWKTRPWTWMDGAIKFVSGWSTTPSGPISFITIVPVTHADACGQTSKFDMAFALDTDPNWVKAEQPFTGLRDWPHYEDEQSTATGLRASSIAIKYQQEPDLTRTGLDVDATVDTPTTWPAQILADDYQCTISGPVTQIWIWGSWYQDAPPGKDANNVEFTLSIREDIPASSLRTYSMPGKVLWTGTFKKGQFAVQQSSSEAQGFYSPCSDKSFTDNHKWVFKYTFTIDSSQAFVQTGTAGKPMVYWLSAQARVAQAKGSTTRFGWKTSASTWNDDAVWTQAREPYSGTWKKLVYPDTPVRPPVSQHTALAFTIITSSESTSEVIERQVADDWKCQQPTPVVAAVWWGSYIGYNDQACACNDQAGPVKPDYFLLSIWSDMPDPDPNNPKNFSHPRQKIWEYKATQYDEVQVGFDKHPEEPGSAKGREAVFRYSVRLPKDQWFTQKQGINVYWFSMVAVYESPKKANYPWGWTNHEHVFNDAAVAGSYVTGTLGRKVWTWQPLKDQTGAGEDMSFVLFQQAEALF